ncbi:MAG: M48 family metalloprotease [Paracoccaceae bacterium]
MSRRRPSIPLGLMLAAGIALAASPAMALGLIRDAEIERTIARLGDPLMRAAGVAPDSVEVYIVNDDALNAFVAGGRNMFLNSGLLAELETPGELQGVIAHEVGHIAGGHLARRQQAVSRLRGPALLGLLLGVAASAAGAGPAGIGLGLGTQGLAERSLLRYSRAEEASADQSAISTMRRAGVNPEGLLEVIARFRGQEVLNFGSLDPYTRTHPLSTQRFQLIERAVAEARTRDWPQDPEDVYWHERMRAKLVGFLDNPRRVLEQGFGEPGSEAELYARAVALHRLPDPEAALETIDRLIAMRPADPFYHELKGQILYEIGRAEAALPSWRRAVALAPGEPLLLGGLGEVLLALDTPAASAEALAVLEEARQSDPGDASMLRSLAVAHARAGEDGMAALVTAERFALVGAREDALLHATRAVRMLPRGSPGWLRAEDILAMADG